ncbi:MAG: cell division protein FtsN [Gammaproteobacteria bacterium]|nr:MAG: cell division protein FtsN [Gammaproteobacteria bacterium]
MANQDYVSKPRPKKKTAKTAVRKSAPVGIGISFKNKVIIVFTLIAIIGFGYFLWVIKDQQPVVETTKTAQKNTIKKTVILPEMPAAKWSYQKGLAAKEVEQGQYEVVDKGPWKMQCASFKLNSQAQELKAKIAFVGIESNVVKSQGKNGLWYKVILGPYKHKRSAERDRHKLKRNNVNYCQIWLWR